MTTEKFDAAKAIKQAAAWFREYEAGHRAKGADDKADRNKERAEYLETALARLTAPVAHRDLVERLRKPSYTVSELRESVGLWGEAADAITAQAAQLEALNKGVTAVRENAALRPLRELLAIIHRDGGHYTFEHGIEKSVADAHQKWAETIAQLEALNKGVAAVREAFLDLIADADEFTEKPDEGGWFYYTLRFNHNSLIPLMKAFGIEPVTGTLLVDGEPFPTTETPAEALCRASNETAQHLPAPAGEPDGGADGEKR